MIFPLDFYSISMRFQQDFCGIKKRIYTLFLWYVHGIPAEVLLDLHEALMGFLRDLGDSPRVSLGFLWEFDAISSGCL